MNADANGEGFRILRTDSALLALDLLWRWSFGLGFLALLFFAYAYLRQAVLLSDADTAAFVSQDPLAIAAAGARLIAGAQPFLLRILPQVASVAAVLWVASAALGRGILTRMIVRRFAVDYGLTVAPDAPRWASFAILKMARVLMLLILVIGFLGGELTVAVLLSPGQSVLTSALILIAALAVAGVVWSYVNWVLSLAPIFVARDGLAALDSLVAALAFLRRNYSHLAAIAIWNSTLRGLAATAITLAGIGTVALRARMPGWTVVALVVLQTLVYLVVSDFFLLARFAAYSSVAVRELSLCQGLPGSSAPPGEAPR